MEQRITAQGDPKIMSYCLNTTCGKPQNPSHYRYCAHCGAKLLLRSRYRAIKPIGEGGFGRRFLAFDGEKPSQPPCVDGKDLGKQVESDGIFEESEMRLVL